MAKFNPDVPENNAKSFVGYSKEIGAVEPSKVAATNIKGITDIGSTLVTGVDNTIKSYIDDKVYDIANSERNQFIQGLEKLGVGVPAQYTNASRVASAEGLVQDDGMNAMAQATPDLPTPIANLDGDNEVAASAGEFGKFKPTQLMANYIQRAKELRNMFPGYKSIIDDKFEKVTGVNSANKYYEYMTAQLNQNMASAQSEQKGMLAYIKQHQALRADSPILAGKVLSGDPTMNMATLMNLYQPALSLKQSKEQIKTDAELRGIDEKQDTDNAHRTMSAEGASASHTIFSSVATPFGTGKQMQAAVIKSMNLPAGHPEKINAQSAVKMYEASRSLEVQLDADLRQKFFTEPGPGGKTIVERLGKDGDKLANEAIEEHKKVVRGVTDLLQQERPDLAGLVAAHVTARTKDLEGYMFDPKQEPIGTFLSMADIMRRRAGETASSQFAINSLGDPKLVDTFNQRFTVDKMQGWANLQGDWGTKGPPWLNRPEAKGNPKWTANATIEGAQTRDQNNTKYTPKDYRSVFDMAKDLTDPSVNDDGKESLMHYYFDPGNRDILRKFDVDTDGKPGRTFVWNTLTDKGITDTAVKLGRTNRDIIHNYTNWALTEWGQNIFKPDIRRLDEISADKNVRVWWDDKNNRIGFEPLPGRVKMSGGGMNPKDDRTDELTIANYNKSVNNINSSLPNLANILQVFGGDPGTEMVRRLLQEGWRPKDGTIPGKIMEAITAPAKKELDEKKAKELQQKGSVSPTNDRGSVKTVEPIPTQPIPHYTTVDEVPTLANWLKNPVPVTGGGREVQTLGVEYGPITVTGTDGKKFTVEGSPENIDKFMNRNKK